MNYKKNELKNGTLIAQGKNKINTQNNVLKET